MKVQVGDWVQHKTAQGKTAIGEVLVVDQLPNDVIGCAATYQLTSCVFVHAVDILEVRPPAKEGANGTDCNV